MKNIALGRYVPYNSFLHRLDPRMKLAGMVALFVIIFLPKLNFESYLIITFSLLFFVKLSHLKLRNLFRTMKVMWLMFIFLLIINICFQRGGPVFLNINGMIIYSQSIVLTIEVFLRMFLLVTISTLLSATTKPLDLTFALEWYMHPLKKIRFPAHEIAMIISLTLRFIPTILEDTQRIIKAQASRGVDMAGGKLREKMAGMIALIIPLFASALERSDELALAMEARGYDSRAKRTKYRVFHFKLRDYLSLFVCAGAIVFFIFFKKYHLIPLDKIGEAISDFFKGIFK